MPDGVMALERRQVVGVEHLRHQADIFVQVHGLPVRDGNTCRLLPAVLQGEQAKEGHRGDIFMRGKNAYNAAFFVWESGNENSYQSSVISEGYSVNREWRPVIS